MERSKLSRKRTKKTILVEQEQNACGLKKTKISKEESGTDKLVDVKIENENENNIVNDVNSFVQRVETQDNPIEDQVEFKKCFSCAETVNPDLYDDHWKKCLKKFENSNLLTSKYGCNICEKDLTHMNEERRNQHMNKCADRKKGSEAELTLECYFCKKTIPSDKRIAHLKLCSRSHCDSGVNLADVMQLMEKQAAERRALGLVLQPVKKDQSRIRSKPKLLSKMDSDMQMAIALSLSMKDERDRQLNDGLIQLDDYLPATSRLLPVGKTRKKVLNKEVPLLVTRTPKERLTIIQNNMVSVMEEETIKTCASVTIGEIVGRNNISRRAKITDSALRVKEDPVLWKKAALDSDLARHSFYVAQLESISPTKTKIGSKLKRMSQIPGRGSSQLPSCTDDRVTPRKTKSPAREPLNETYADSDKFNCSGFFTDNAERVTFEDAADSFCGLITDFSAMLTNPELSDIKIRTKDNVVTDAHRFVLYARCPALREKLKENFSSRDTLTLDWTEVTSKSTKLFLEFLYCGTLSGGCDDEIDQLSYLASKFNVQRLKERLAALTKKDYPKDEPSAINVDRDSFALIEIESDTNEENDASKENFTSDEKCDVRARECFSPELLPLDCDVEFEPNVTRGDSSPIISSSCSLYGRNKHSEKAKECSYNNTVEKTVINDEVEEFIELDTSTPFSKRVRSRFDACSSKNSPARAERDNKTERRSYSSEMKQKLKQIEESFEKLPEVIRFDRESNELNRTLNSSLRNCYSQPEFQNVYTDDIWCGFDDNGFNADLGQVDFQAVDSDVNDCRALCAPAQKNDPVIELEVNEKRRVARKKTKAHRIGKVVSASQPVTPMPGFTDMDTPEIHNHLKKFGIRQMPRKKAVRLLEHVYEKTHPLVTDSEHDDSVRTDQLPQNEESDLNSSQSSTECSDNRELLEETYFLEEPQIPPGKNQAEALKKFIRENADIQRTILLYEPINIRDLHNKVKSSGIKIKLSTLKEFLDEQCITFTMPRDRPFTSKGRKT